MEAKVNHSFGIDLVPRYSPLPVVGQCKLREKSYTWQMVCEELTKTDKFENPIEHYLLFTTAPPHTTIQDVQNRGAYYHTRPDGSRFQVQVYFWSQIKHLEYIPLDVRARIFPDAFAISNASTDSRVAVSGVIESIGALRSYVSSVISREDLNWLEHWDYSCGFVPAENFSIFDKIYIDHDRAKHGLNGIVELLYEGNRAQLATAIPAGERFFSALAEFRNAVNGSIISSYLENGVRVLSVNDLPIQAKQRAISNWESTAAHLAQVYREDILGEPKR